MDSPKRLSGPTQLTTSGVVQYTVPAATTTVIRSIHAYNVNVATANFTLGIGGVTAALSLYSAFPVPTVGTLDWSGFLVLNAGDTLNALSGTSASLTLTISGIEVS
jgi:hypothetical protein